MLVQLEGDVGYFNRVLGAAQKESARTSVVWPLQLPVERSLFCAAYPLCCFFFAAFSYSRYLFFTLSQVFFSIFFRLIICCRVASDCLCFVFHLLISLGRGFPRHAPLTISFFAFCTSRNLGPTASPHLASSPVHPSFPATMGLVRDVTSAGIVGGKLPSGDKLDTLATVARPIEVLQKTVSKKKEKEKEKDVMIKEDGVPVVGPRRDSKVAATPEHRGAEFTMRLEDGRVFGEDVIMAGIGEKAPQHGDAISKALITPGDVIEKPTASKRKKETAPVLDHPDEMQGVETEKDRKEAEKKDSEKKRKRHVADEDPHPPLVATVSEDKLVKNTSHASKARPSTSDGLATAQQTPSANKRGQRKRADSSAAAIAAAHITRAMKVEEPEEEVPVAEDEDADADAEDDGDGDEDEPVYCYCQQVSYGEMVACDADNCPREWFHLSCVGLQQAPRGKGMPFVLPPILS